LAGDPENPQSLNRYAYGLNDPLNLVDPNGLKTCLAGMGINTRKGSWDSALGDMGVSAVYPYTGGKLRGIGSVGSQDYWGAPNGATNKLSNGVNTGFDPNDKDNTLLLISGSAQAASTGWNLINPEVRASITTIIYLSPGTGMFSKLPGINTPGVNAPKFHGVGPADFFTTLFSRLHGGRGTKLNCKHGDLQCQLNKIREQYLKDCKKKQRPEPFEGDGILYPVRHGGFTDLDILGLVGLPSWPDPCPNGDCGPFPPPHNPGGFSPR